MNFLLAILKLVLSFFFLVLLKQDGMRIFIKEKSMIKNAGVKTDFVCFLNVLNLMEEFFV